MFDLDAAIVKWSRDFRARTDLSGTSVDELEGHLRDAVEQLVAQKSLTEEEGLLVACHRLGTPAQLEQEYGKVHGTARWLGRAVHMLSGFLVISLLLKAVVVEQALAGWLGLKMGMGRTDSAIPLFGSMVHHGAALFAIGVGLLSFAVVVWLILRFAGGPKTETGFTPGLYSLYQTASGSVGACIAWWIALYLLFEGVLVGLQMTLHRTLVMEEFATFHGTLSVYNYGVHVLTWGALLALTAVLHRRYRALLA